MVFRPYEKFVLRLMLKKARNERKTRLAGQRDDLTGLPNLKAARELIPGWLRRTRGNFYLGFVDIDYFKSVNDCHCHQIGDLVLRAFAQVASRFFPGRFFRVGGEEFLWCFSGSEEAVLDKAEKFRAAVEIQTGDIANSLILRHLPPKGPEPFQVYFPITVSQGIAVAGANCVSFEELRLKADEETYLAKDMGRNCVVFQSRLHSKGLSPVHYTRELVKMLHHRAQQKGFSGWWKMQEHMGRRERQRLIENCFERIYPSRRTREFLKY